MEAAEYTRSIYRKQAIYGGIAMIGLFLKKEKGKECIPGKADHLSMQGLEIRV
jgi:hypothetical protein